MKMKGTTMDNVIDFMSARTIKVKKYDSKFEYLVECKTVLEREDYIDVLAGIMDIEIYNELEPEIRMIIDTYYEMNFDD
jgi:hypothetical protein